MKMGSITEIKIKFKGGTVIVTDDAVIIIEDLDGFKLLEAMPDKIKVKKEMEIVKI